MTRGFWKAWHVGHYVKLSKQINDLLSVIDIRKSALRKKCASKTEKSVEEKSLEQKCWTEQKSKSNNFYFRFLFPSTYSCGFRERREVSSTPKIRGINFSSGWRNLNFYGLFYNYVWMGCSQHYVSKLPSRRLMKYQISSTNRSFAGRNMCQKEKPWLSGKNFTKL